MIIDTDGCLKCTYKTYSKSIPPEICTASRFAFPQRECMYHLMAYSESTSSIVVLTEERKIAVFALNLEDIKQSEVTSINRKTRKPNNHNNVGKKVNALNKEVIGGNVIPVDDLNPAEYMAAQMEKSHFELKWEKVMVFAVFCSSIYLASANNVVKVRLTRLGDKVTAAEEATQYLGFPGFRV